MEVMDLLDLLTNESSRLEQTGNVRSSMIFSTVLPGGKIAKMTVSVELIEQQQRVYPQVPQQSAVPPMQQSQQQPQMR